MSEVLIHLLDNLLICSAFCSFNDPSQSLALSACTTLVSIEPRLPMETRNRVMKVLDY